MRVSLRAARPEDADSLFPMMRALYEHEGLAFPEETIRAALAALFASRETGAVWFLLADGAVAGYALATWGFSTEQGGRFLLLDELFVLPGDRGRGVGREALALLEEEARRGGGFAVRLEVGETNERARRLYAAAGYADPGRRFLARRLGTPPVGRRLRPERVEAKALVAASPERLWEAIATGPGLDGWFTTGAVVEARPGGRILFRWEDWGPDRFSGAYEGRVLEADPPRRLVFRWPVDARTYDTTVAIALEPRGGVTLLTLAEEGFEEGPDGLREMLARSNGWGEALAFLKVFLEHGVRA